MNSRLQKWRRVLVAILLCPALVRAADVVTIADFSSKIDASGIPAGWQVKERSGKADFAVVKDDGMFSA